MSDQTVIEHRVKSLEDAVVKIQEAVSSIALSMQAIVRLEEHHTQTRDSVGRAFEDIGDHEKRLRILEGDAPTMRLVRGWVIAWVLGAAAIISAAVAGLVVGKTS